MSIITVDLYLITFPHHQVDTSHMNLALALVCLCYTGKFCPDICVGLGIEKILVCSGDTNFPP